MINDEGSANAKMTEQRRERGSRDQNFVTASGFVIRHSSLRPGPIASDDELASLIDQIESADRVAVDTEADSLHSYREKLCLLQISVPAPGSTAHGHEPARAVCDFMVDPLANTNLEPLRRTLEAREIVLHGADYDLRMLRRGLNLVAKRIFDTLIAARLLGIREFSLAALLKRYLGLTLVKGSQKAI